MCAMIRPTPSSYPLYALILSAGLLGGAWFFQYVLGYYPCTMCYWQRHAHKIIIGLAVVALVLKQFKPRLFAPNGFRVLLILAFLGSASVAFSHVGVEYLWWDGPKTCATGPLNLGQPVDLLAELSKKTKPPACSEVVWSLFGISMAGYNMLASLLGAALGLFAKAK